VLENISFEVAEGEALVLLGASGSGKTTILRIIAGLERGKETRRRSRRKYSVRDCFIALD
jgi:ABC-type Fe3+/spermidine/putrescine transport system ATPase subunit